MRSLIKLVMAAAICMSPVIAHQQTLTSRLADRTLKFDALMDKHSERIPHTAEPYSKALLGEMNAVKDQVSGLIQELGCRNIVPGQMKAVDDPVSDLIQEIGGELVWDSECLLLLSEDTVLKVWLLAAKFKESAWKNLGKKEQTLTSRLADLTLKYNAVENSENIPRTLESDFKVLIGQIKAINNQTSDLSQELGDESGREWECLSLPYKVAILKMRASIVEFKLNIIEKKQAAAGVRVEKSWKMWWWH